MKKNISHSTMLKAQYNSNRLNILFLTGIDENIYCDFISETAATWLKIHFKEIMDIDSLVETTFFWKWFRSQWNYLDDALYLSRLWDAPKNERLTIYRQLHQELFDQENKYSRFIYDDFIALMDDWTNAIIDLKTQFA